MNITIKSVSLQNFTTYKKAKTFNLDSGAINLITGSNGSGKSSIIDAVTYAIYNKPYRGSKLDSLINYEVNKNMLVTITIENEKGVFVIQRGRKPSVFTLEFNGKSFDTKGRTTEIQRAIVDRIMGGIEYDLFSQIIVLGASFKPFLTLTRPKRRSLLIDILNYRDLFNVHDKLKERMVVCTAELGKLNRIKRENNIYLTQISDCKTKMQDIYNESKLFADGGECEDKITDILRHQYSVQKETYDALRKKLNVIPDGEYQALDEELTMIDNIVDVFSNDEELFSTIMRDYTQHINNFINGIINILGLSKYYIELESDAGVHIYTDSSMVNEVSYNSVSEGEKLRINISLIFAIQKLIMTKTTIKINLLFIDEMLDSSLDNEGLKGFLQLLEKFGKNTYIITHNPKRAYVEHATNEIKL